MGLWNRGTTSGEGRPASRRPAQSLGRAQNESDHHQLSIFEPSRGSCRSSRLIHAYLERHQHLQRPSGEFNFFEQQADQARVTLEQAELAVMEFTHRNSVVDAPLQRDATLQKLTELQASSAQAAIQIQESTQRERELQAKLDTSAARMTTQVRISDNPSYSRNLNRACSSFNSSAPNCSPSS